MSRFPHKEAAVLCGYGMMPAHQPILYPGFVGLTTGIDKYRIRCCSITSNTGKTSWFKKQLLLFGYFVKSNTHTLVSENARESVQQLLLFLAPFPDTHLSKISATQKCKNSTHTIGTDEPLRGNQLCPSAVPAGRGTGRNRPHPCQPPPGRSPPEGAHCLALPGQPAQPLWPPHSQGCRPLLMLSTESTGQHVSQVLQAECPNGLLPSATHGGLW